jgi:CheY-like chemotaxis protein/HPt (histidine-containing phosphotransfer) domain-containing protein
MTGESSPDDLPPELLEEYRRGVRVQLQEVAALADRLTVAGDDRDALDALRREAHKIHGSAGSYGYHEGSRLAAGMEATAKDWLADPADAVADRGALARWFVVRLAAALQLEAPPTDRTDRPTAPARRLSDIVEVPEIIVVEDDPALAELLEYGLESRGYRFVAMRNGREALEYLRTLDTSGQTPLLLLDVDLPGLDGYAVFEELQRVRPGAYRTVFTTVHGREEEQLRGLEAGAHDYLVKPINLRVVLEKIRRWVGR